MSGEQAARRPAEIDRSYRAYDERPIDEPDEWGDLAAFREATSGVVKGAEAASPDDA